MNKCLIIFFFSIIQIRVYLWLVCSSFNIEEGLFFIWISKVSIYFFIAKFLYCCKNIYSVDSWKFLKLQKSNYKKTVFSFLTRSFEWLNLEIYTIKEIVLNALKYLSHHKFIISFTKCCLRICLWFLVYEAHLLIRVYVKNEFIINKFKFLVKTQTHPRKHVWKCFLKKHLTPKNSYNFFCQTQIESLLVVK